jgi:hypothetical protein
MDSEEKNLDIAYYIPHRFEHLTLKLRRSANAWWLDASKVYRLLDAFERYDATIEEACDAARITVKQYKYFVQLHPIINEIRKAPAREKDFDKRIGLYNALQNNTPESAIQWLRYTEPEEWDLRYRSSPLTRIRRRLGITAKYLEEQRRPKSQEEKNQEMLDAVERSRSY